MAKVAEKGIQTEVYISVDVETSGPNPSDYDMLSIGACRVDDLDASFYIELKPVTCNAIPGALAISDLSLEALCETGVEPREAMKAFEDWVHAVVSDEERPVFVALNAPFDWMFVSDYFHRTLRRNPFGHSALDIKAFYMGLTGTRWALTSMRYLSRKYLDGRKLEHHALQDAKDQAELFNVILDKAKHHDYK